MTQAKTATSMAKASPAKTATKTAKKLTTKATAAQAATRKKVSKTSKPVTGGLTEARLVKMKAADYMNANQLEFFRQRLLQMRIETDDRQNQSRERLQSAEETADENDRATLEEQRWIELRLREREATLSRKIEDALQRIRDGDFGYCEVTGEAIGVPRLLARPTATVCVDVKEFDERREVKFRD